MPMAQYPSTQTRRADQNNWREVRSHKESLAQLITLEVGKITQEALGEVQEVIDMAEFAVGQSRMLWKNHGIGASRP